MFLERLNIDQLRLIFDLLLAEILGFIIGLERKARNKEAGIRTHTSVEIDEIMKKHEFV